VRRLLLYEANDDFENVPKQPHDALSANDVALFLHIHKDYDFVTALQSRALWSKRFI
jgi:hypothetical protein